MNIEQIISTTPDQEARENIHQQFLKEILILGEREALEFARFLADALADANEQAAANLKDLPVKPHPHFDLMMKYVEIAQTTDKPWEAFQVKGFVDEWLDVSAAILFNENLQYRLKPEPPKTIRIGEYDVPEPVREPLEKDTEYWIVHFSLAELAVSFKWYSDKFDNRVLKNGLIHLTKEAAVIHAEALLSLTKAAE